MQTSAEASPPRLIRRPILTQVGALMAVILVLGVSAMLGSMVIAQVNQGMASAVNQAGTLRMQSYRIGMRQPFARVKMREDVTLEVVLRCPRRFDALPDHTDKPYVVDRRERLHGILTLEMLLIHHPETEVRQVMQSKRLIPRAGDAVPALIGAGGSVPVPASPIQRLHQRLQVAGMNLPDLPRDRALSQQYRAA